MKTLLKLAKSNKELPILRAVCVHEGLITATDMDIVIAEGIKDTPDGLYHADGFDSGIRAPYGEPVDNFPILMQPHDELGSFEINVSDLEFASRFITTDKTRYYLNGICLHDKDMVSTDGHRLGKVAYDLSFPKHPDYDSGVIIPADAVKYCLLLAKEYKQKSIRAVLYANRFIATIGDATLSSKLIDGTFVEYSRLIPADAEKTTPLNPAEFAKKEKELNALARIEGKRHGFPIQIGDGTASTKFDKAPNLSFPVSTHLTEEACYNFDYLLSMPAGDLHFYDRNSPIKIISGNRLAVLMPRRF